MISWKTQGTALYQKLPAELHETLQVVEPLREIEPDRPLASADYQTWNQVKS